MAKVSYFDKFIEKKLVRKKEKIEKTEIQVECDYDVDEDEVSNVEINLWRNGIYVGEFSGLFHKINGNPFCAIVDNTNWAELYAQQYGEPSEDFTNSKMDSDDFN